LDFQNYLASKKKFDLN